MKWVVCALVAVGLIIGAPATAADTEFRPIDTKKLVVQPSKTAANLAAGTINLVGQTTAGAVENNGYIKTINNLFKKKDTTPTVQAGRSGLPAPYLYKSTQYNNYNTPVMPQLRPR